MGFCNFVYVDQASCSHLHKKPASPGKVGVQPSGTLLLYKLPLQSDQQF